MHKSPPKSRCILSIVTEEQTVLNSTTEAIVIKRGFGFILRTGPTDTVIFVPFMTMWEKQILARAIGIEKENWG